MHFAAQARDALTSAQPAARRTARLCLRNCYQRWRSTAACCCGTSGALRRFALRRAQTHVDMSFGNSFEFTRNNIMGTHVMLETSRVCSTVRRFVHVSTDEVYGEVSHCTGTASAEKSTLEPTNPYSASKAAAEMLVRVRALASMPHARARHVSTRACVPRRRT